MQSVAGLNRTKRLSDKNTSCLTARAGTLVFSSLELELKPWFFLGLKSASFQTGTTPSALLGRLLAKCRS